MKYKAERRKGHIVAALYNVVNPVMGSIVNPVLVFVECVDIFAVCICFNSTIRVDFHCLQVIGCM